MNNDIFQGKWHEIKGQLKQQWGKITDDDITKMKGSFEELSGFLQKTYGYEKDRSKTEIETFLNKNGWNK